MGSLIYHTKLSKLKRDCANLKQQIMNSDADADCVKELKQEYIKKASDLLRILHNKNMRDEEKNKTDNPGEQNLSSIIK